MFEQYLKKAVEIVESHRIQYQGVYYMKGGVIGDVEKGLGKATNAILKPLGTDYNAVRNIAEDAAVLGANYALPGSAIVTNNLASKGSKSALKSPLGTIGEIGTGLAGAGVGSSVTGIPSAASEGAGWANALNGISSLADSAGTALGLTDSAGTASALSSDAASGVTAADVSAPAAPWVDPDAAITPGSSVASGSPLDSIDASNAAVNPDNLTGNGINIGNTALGNAGNPAAGETSLFNVPSTSLGNAIPAATTAGNAATAAAAPTSSLLSSVGKYAGPLVAATGIGLDLLKGKQPIPAETALTNQAAQQGAQGAALQNYVTSGTLPPGAQAGITAAANSAKAAIRSKYASMGMSGSSSEQQELSQVDINAQAQGEQEAVSLLNSGIAESSLSSSLYQSLLNNTLQQDQNLSSAIGNFAGSLAGSTKSPNITSNV